MTSKEIVRWPPPEAVMVLPKSASTAEAMAPYAKQLTEREQRQVVRAYQSGSYEMGSAFIWSRAMATLKKQLATLGTDFVAELLERPDMRTDISFVDAITDYDAVSLAEELGMFTATQALRLRNALQLVSHFAAPPPDGEEDEHEMMPEDAIGIFRACVRGILGQEELASAHEFTAFRRLLDERTFASNDREIIGLMRSPSLYIRTTLRVLIALAKTARGAQLEHSLGNLNVVLPLIWENHLNKPDRWLVGRTYAELQSNGQRVAAVGLRKALVKVHGFDYVPENLRSSAFLEKAQKVLEAHFARDNFYNEPKPMEALAELGTVIPTPALHRCISAALCVRLGNNYGVSNAAQPHAIKMLDLLSGDRWSYYLRHCLRDEKAVLQKLMTERTVKRWFTVVEQYRLGDIQDVSSQDLINASVSKDVEAVGSIAKRLLFDPAQGPR